MLVLHLASLGQFDTLYYIIPSVTVALCYHVVSSIVADFTQHNGKISIDKGLGEGQYGHLEKSGKQRRDEHVRDVQDATHKIPKENSKHNKKRQALYRIDPPENILYWC